MRHFDYTDGISFLYFKWPWSVLPLICWVVETPGESSWYFDTRSQAISCMYRWYVYGMCIRCIR